MTDTPKPASVAAARHERSPKSATVRDPRRLQAMLLTLCIATFLTRMAGTALAPFLLNISRELDVDVAFIANLISIMSVTWGVSSLVAGTVSDRVGRPPVLVAGLVALFGGTMAFSQSATYAWAIASQLLAGIGGGAFMGTVLAAVSDRVGARERGRALGWISTGQSLSLVLGVPLVTFAGSLVGWRGAIMVQSVSLLVLAVVVWFVVPADVQTSTSKVIVRPPLKELLTPRIVALLAAGTTERVCFGGLAVYLATYLLTSYGISLRELAVVLALVAAGNLLGNILGSHLADRLPSRPMLFAAASVATALFAMPLMMWQPGLPVTVGLGFAYAMSNALGRPALLAALSEVPVEGRGTVLGLNITSASVGWITATALGGWLIATYGFGSLGYFGAVTGLLGAMLGATAWWAGRRAAGTAGASSRAQV